MVVHPISRCLASAANAISLLVPRVAVESSYLLQVVDDPGKTEASAMSAFTELMEEESQAAAKVAAKKAKKLKQKSKKQQAQQLQSSPQEQPPKDTEAELSDSDSALESRSPELIPGLGAQPAAAVTTPPQSPRSRPAHLQATLTPAKHGVSLDDSGVKSEGNAELSDGVQVNGIADVPAQQGNAGDEGLDPATPSADADAEFVQALFRCPITKVGTLHFCPQHIPGPPLAFVVLVMQ